MTHGGKNDDGRRQEWTWNDRMRAGIGCMDHIGMHRQVTLGIGYLLWVQHRRVAISSKYKLNKTYWSTNASS